MNYLEKAKIAIGKYGDGSPPTSKDISKAKGYALIAIAEELHFMNKDAHLNQEDPEITRFEWDEYVGKNVPVTRRQSVWNRLDSQ